MKDPAQLTLTTELRAKTAQVHEALDSKLTHAFEQVDQYIAFLRASYRVLSNLDRALGDLVQRPMAERCAQVASDLEALGQASPQADPAAWQPTDVAEAMGCAYVVEGSRLGGLVLAKVVERQLGLSATNYLRGKGPLTKDSWKGFMTELDTWGEHAAPAERQRAAQGAIATFTAYTRCFADEGLLEA
jgi:heme oxygenase (biliverdin-IX-beta and delta-forming)